MGSLVKGGRITIQFIVSVRNSWTRTSQTISVWEHLCYTRELSNRCQHVGAKSAVIIDDDRLPNLATITSITGIRGAPVHSSFKRTPYKLFIRREAGFLNGHKRLYFEYICRQKEIQIKKYNYEDNYPKILYTRLTKKKKKFGQLLIVNRKALQSAAVSCH